MKHARSYTASSNPIVNSYKRLVPGYEAPVYVVGQLLTGHHSREFLSHRGMGTRLELRSADPSANPYLASLLFLKLV